MPPKLGAAPRCRRPPRRLGIAAACALTLAIAAVAARAQPLAPPGGMLDRLCAQSLRSNEEDRLFGMISITVRATIKYYGAVSSPDLIDESVQNALAAIIDACPRIAAADSTQRLGMAVALISDATARRLADGNPRARAEQTDRATAADLSEELSAQEIDAWLDELPTRERALAVFLYASGLTDAEMAGALGLTPAALTAGFREAKSDLLRFFRQQWTGPLAPAIPAPAMSYRQSRKLVDLLQPDPAHPAGAASVRISGISSDFYAGWSLLATAQGLPADRSLDLDAPILLAPDAPGRKRMVAVALDEIGDPHDNPRRFLVKAYAADAGGDGAGLHDTFHLAAAALSDAQVAATLRNRGLASIEIARCLWYDFATANDPGLCR